VIEDLIGEPILPDFHDSEQKLERLQKEQEANLQRAGDILDKHGITLKILDSAIISGFDLASVNGPLMDEPMQGAVFIVEGISLDRD
jgi:hypothetical protein